MGMKSFARNKGHSFERRVAQTFRNKGWVTCLTSRLESKHMDYKGVDLMYTHPFYVQCKAVERSSMGPHDILANMPIEKDIIRVLFHKRNRKGTVVSLSEEDFWKLLELTNLPS